MGKDETFAVIVYIHGDNGPKHKSINTHAAFAWRLKNKCLLRKPKSKLSIHN